MRRLYGEATQINIRCRIELLGGLRVLQSERSITRFRTRQTGALLAYLAYHLGRHLPREVVIEAIWPEVEAKTGRNNLSIALNSLRGQLEPSGTAAGSVLQADRFAVGLNPTAVVTDVAEFLSALQAAETANDDAGRNAALRQAIDLYHGELLPGFYDEWVLENQPRLQALYEQAEEALNHFGFDASPSACVPAVTAPTLPTLKPQSANTHLPLQFTRFFGREEELELLKRWVVGALGFPTTPLITLTGPGGTGKTRLAIEAAGQLGQTFPGGVWFVPLQDLYDPRLIPGTVLDALHLPRSPQSEPFDQVVEFLNSRAAATLLLLDNMEQLLDPERRKAEDGAAVVRALLERCSSLTCLVTSRQRLDLEGERELPILPLPVPGDVEEAGPSSPERLLEFASVQLFVDRAQSSKPDFQVTEGNEEAIAQLCDRLEGIPLALELAARRAQVMTPKQMLSQLEHRFDFLVSRRRDAIDRHRTLRAAIEWSYRLLSTELQRFFAGLSVFRGGWTLEAAEAICQEPQALEYLAQLRESSLILAEEHEEKMRFRMLETLREFGQEQLPDEEHAVLHSRHLDFYLALAEPAKEALWGQGDFPAALERLRPDYDNLRGALEWCRTNATGDERYARLCLAFFAYCQHTNNLKEAQRWLKRVLASPAAAERTLLRAALLGSFAYCAGMEGDYPTAQAACEENAAISSELGDTFHVLDTHTLLGGLLMLQGQYDRGRTHLEKSLALAREVGDPWQSAFALKGLGDCALKQGEFERAQAAYEEALDLYRTQPLHLRGRVMGLGGLARLALLQGEHDRAEALGQEHLQLSRRLNMRDHVAWALSILGDVQRHRSDFAFAHSLYREALTIARELGEKTILAETFDRLGELARDCAAPRRATCLMAAAAVLRESTTAVMSPVEQEAYHRSVSALRRALGEEAFAVAWAEGRAMTLERAITYALETVAA